MNLSPISIADLISLRDRVATQIKDFEAEAIEKARAEISAIATRVGIPLAELMGKAGKTEVKNRPRVKYRNPADPSKEWTGRSRSPR